jgi:nucleoside-diphosphate-sugar epimerase
MAPLLVTGCAGFIGARVVELLLDGGCDVVGVDNLNDAYDPRLKHWRLARLHATPGFRFVELDIADRAAVQALFQNPPRDAAPRSEPRKPAPGAVVVPEPPAHDDAAPFAAVLNLAARAGVRASVADPEVYYRANVLGTLHLLEACRHAGVKKFLLASTSSAYGGDNPVPFREEADTSRPLSPYAASKLAAETLAYTYHRLHGLDVSVPRFFTVYGPAGRPDMSVFRFVRMVAEGRPIVVFGDGRQQRDFTYVDDIARGAVAALRPLGYEVINLGSDRPVPLSQLIETIGGLLGREPAIVRRPAHPADVPSTWADISKARRLLDWSPQVPLEEGLRRCVDWYLAERGWASAIDLGD